MESSCVEDLTSRESISETEEGLPPRYNTYDMILTKDGHIRFASGNVTGDLYKITLPSNAILPGSTFYGRKAVYISENPFQSSASTSSDQVEKSLSEYESPSSSNDEILPKQSSSNSNFVQIIEPENKVEATRTTVEAMEIDMNEEIIADASQISGSVVAEDLQRKVTPCEGLSKTSSPDDIVIPCGSCVLELQAVAFCVDCNFGLCQACKEYHLRRKSTYRHKIKEDLKDVQKKQFETLQKCLKHRDSNKTYDGLVSAEWICNTCIGKHADADHEIGKLENTGPNLNKLCVEDKNKGTFRVADEITETEENHDAPCGSHQQPESSAMPFKSKVAAKSASITTKRPKREQKRRVTLNSEANSAHTLYESFVGSDGMVKRKCKLCGLETQGKVYMERHIMLHEPKFQNQSRKCEICGWLVMKTAWNTHRLKNHIVTTNQM